MIRFGFKWKDYRGGDQVKTMTLGAGDFIRRFLLHVLPNGFRRIRYYGFLGNRHREEKLAVCRRLLGMPQVEKGQSPNRRRKQTTATATKTSLAVRSANVPPMQARQHGGCPDPLKVFRPISGSRGFLMIRSADSELAANGCWSSGTSGEVRTFRGFVHSVSLTRLIIPRTADTTTSQTVPAPTFRAHMHLRCPPLPRRADHSKPIDRTVVERFSPTRV